MLLCSFTKDRDYEYYDKFSSEAENNSITRGRSRIPVALNSSKKQAKTRTANQLELLKPRLRLEKEDGEIIKKGLMWIQQDKIFSTWKERFVILTTSHLQIFKKGTTKFSDMGTFINKVRPCRVAPDWHRLCPGLPLTGVPADPGGEERLPHPPPRHGLAHCAAPAQEAGRTDWLAGLHSEPLRPREGARHELQEAAVRVWNIPEHQQRWVTNTSSRSYQQGFSEQEQCGRVSLLLHRKAVQLAQTEAAVIQAGREPLRVWRPGQGRNIPGASTPGQPQRQAEAKPSNVLVVCDMWQCHTYTAHGTLGSVYCAHIPVYIFV